MVGGGGVVVGGGGGCGGGVVVGGGWLCVCVWAGGGTGRRHVSCHYDMVDLLPLSDT